MKGLLWAGRVALFATWLFGLALLFASERSWAATLTFDPTAGGPFEVATVPAGPGTLTFVLNVDPDAPDALSSGVFGSFTMEIFGEPGLSGSPLGDITLSPFPLSDTNSPPYGPINGTSNSEDMALVTTWTFLVTAGMDFPLHVYVTSNFEGWAGREPILTMDFEAAPAAVPLPAALPLFVSGLGLLGFMGWRRRQQTASASVAAR